LFAKSAEVDALSVFLYLKFFSFVKINAAKKFSPKKDPCTNKRKMLKEGIWKRKDF